MVGNKVLSIIGDMSDDEDRHLIEESAVPFIGNARLFHILEKYYVFGQPYNNRTE